MTCFKAAGSPTVPTRRHGRKGGIVHELQCIPLEDSGFLVSLLCERGRLFSMPLYGPARVVFVGDPIDCMACIAERCT